MSLKNKIKKLTKEEFFVKLFEYDQDLKLSTQFSMLARFYESKNIRVEYFTKHKEENTLLFYIQPKIRNTIGYRLRRQTHEKRKDPDRNYE